MTLYSRHYRSSLGRCELHLGELFYTACEAYFFLLPILIKFSEVVIPYVYNTGTII